MSDVPAAHRRPATPPRWMVGLAWGLALILAAGAALLWWNRRVGASPLASPTAAATATPLPTATPQPLNTRLSLPPLDSAVSWNGLHRRAMLHTIIPSRPRTEVIQYTVQPFDSVFGIAKKFGIKPETVLWANYEVLNDNPDLLKPGQTLNIPPVDGVYYKWQEGDTLESVAEKFDAKVEDIVNFLGNHLDLSNPQVEPGQYVMVPGGHREFRQWLVPTIPRGQSGVSLGYLGPGACPGGYSGAYGTGTFVWPATNHYLSGNDYWSGHLGIDIAAGMGMGIFAADSGVVVFAGWSNVGYGYMVMIDHGNGYQTLYAHLSQVNVVCGQSVFQGQLIGLAGSTGNSSGPHLHFEVRYNGGFINPWYVLPAP